MLSAWTPSCCLTCRACSLVEFLVHVGVDQLADAAVDGVHQALDEVLLDADARLGRAQRGGRVGHRRDRRVDTADVSASRSARSSSLSVRAEMSSASVEPATE